jgi:hypothetical protein
MLLYIKKEASMAITAISPRYLDKISTKILKIEENLAPDQKRLIKFSSNAFKKHIKASRERLLKV